MFLPHYRLGSNYKLWFKLCGERKLRNTLWAWLKPCGKKSTQLMKTQGKWNCNLKT